MQTTATLDVDDVLRSPLGAMTTRNSATKAERYCQLRSPLGAMTTVSAGLMFSEPPEVLRSPLGAMTT